MGQGKAREGKRRIDSHRKDRSKAGIEQWWVLNTRDFYFGNKSLSGRGDRNNQRVAMSIIYFPCSHPITNMTTAITSDVVDSSDDIRPTICHQHPYL